MTTVAATPATMAQALNAALRDAHGRRRPACTSSARTSARSAASSAITDGLARRVRRGPLHRTPRWPRRASSAPAVGMAMYGLRPVVEMQFDAFAYPAFEQIARHVAKMRNRTRGARCRCR